MKAKNTTKQITSKRVAMDVVATTPSKRKNIATFRSEADSDNGFRPEFSVIQDNEITPMAGLQQKVFLDRYALKDVEGELIEHIPEEMWKRVAWGISQSEKKDVRQVWEQKFYQVMKDFKFVPGGRILSGAGTGYQVTYFNCFVIPSPKDSRGGILESLRQLVEIQARAGGVGLNLSSLRPRGARVKKVNGVSSGPVTWAGLFSYATHDVVQQGGSRRGATMLMLWDWHPDVEEFITVKQDLSKINGANLSVCVSDAFMEAVKQDADWDLIYPDIDDPEYDAVWDGDINAWKESGRKVKVYKTVKAKYLWDLICEAAWRSAEPGLHFLERSNSRSNTWYFEKLVATNPCVTADTWIQTSQGPRQVHELLGVPFKARVNGSDNFSYEGFFSTGEKDVLTLSAKEGYSLRLTANHKVQKVSKITKHTLQSEWVEAQTLNPGDQILLNNHRQNPEWSGNYGFSEGYLMGLLIGDGTVKKDKSVLSVWNPGTTGSGAVMSEVSQIMQSSGNLNTWMSITARNEYRFSNAYIKSLAKELGMSVGNKIITSMMEKSSSDFNRGLLRGLFDTDGSVQGSQSKGVSVRLAQSNLTLLQSVQRILLRLGIVSSIYQDRREAGYKNLPDGKGGVKSYPVKAQHELVISGNNLAFFQDLIGFKDSMKSSRLKMLLKNYKRTLNKECFVITVDNLIISDKEEVFDVSVPGVNAFDANGIMAHNCGEQPLGPWAVCNLGAMNLAAYVKNSEFDYEQFGQDVQVSMRMLDNVIDQTYYFFSENERCAKDIRRTGLGIMGLADALIKMKVRYGSEESFPVIEKMFATLRDNAYEASSDIAKEKGAFPLFDKEKYLEGHHVRALPEKIREKIAKQGIRNAVLLTVAPTGTTSVIAAASSGVEPVYEFSYLQRWRGGEDIVYHPLYETWLKENPEAEKPAYFVGANDLTPLEHVKVQAIAQKYIDSSISKTVNAPNAHTVEDVKTLYMAAYDMGLKGVTYMRDGSRQGVLERLDKKEEEGKKEEAPVVVHRPMVLAGRTYKVLTPVGESFITINRDEQGSPMEVFATISKAGSHVGADAEAIGRLISLSLRNATDRAETAKKIVTQLRGIGGSSQVGFGKDRVMSLADAIAKALSEDLAYQESAANQEAQALPLDISEHANEHETNGHSNGHSATQLSMVDPSQMAQKNADICPDCGNATLISEEGCYKCFSCGYSKC